MSCGQTFTLAITEDGLGVFGWGEADDCSFGSRELTGDHSYPIVSDYRVDNIPYQANHPKVEIVVLLRSLSGFQG